MLNKKNILEKLLKIIIFFLLLIFFISKNCFLHAMEDNKSSSSSSKRKSDFIFQQENKKQKITEIIISKETPHPVIHYLIEKDYDEKLKKIQKSTEKYLQKQKQQKK